MDQQKLLAALANANLLSVDLKKLNDLNAELQKMAPEDPQASDWGVVFDTEHYCIVHA